MSQQTPREYNGPERIPIAVLMACTPVSGNRWISERWSFAGCATDPSGLVDKVQSDLVRDDAEGAERWVRWRGLTLALHRDAAEDYWFNLSGDTPRVYLVARLEEGTQPTPFLLTLDHGEAGAYAEADEEVFSAPLPAELYHRVERFVLTHFQPRAHYKRKRKNWSESGA